MIDRVSVSQDDEGVWYLGFYADDIRYGVPITEDTIPILEMAQEEAAQQPRALDGLHVAPHLHDFTKGIYCPHCGESEF